MNRRQTPTHARDEKNVYEGKLYLNFNADINKTFSKNPSALITKANHNWPALNQ
jgi:hypothetical protein